MPAMKNLAGIRAAKQIALEAAKGTAIGLGFAMVWKVTVMDYQKKEISNYYATHKFDDK